MRRISSLIIAMAVLLSGCASIPPGGFPPGRFSGEVIVMWVGEGGGASGDGRFLFVPNPRRPLTFTRATNGPGRVVRPKMMYTDGGSIPRIAQVFRGLSPWGYAPAYMVHDWLFVARHCQVDGDPNPIYQATAEVRFEDSAMILGEAIESLMASNQVAKNDVAAGAIGTAVGGGLSRSLWDARGACAANQVSPAHRAVAENAIPGSSSFRRRSGRPGAPQAVIVARVTF